MVDNQIENGLIRKQNTKKQGCENAKMQNAKMWKVQNCKTAKRWTIKLKIGWSQESAPMQREWSPCMCTTLYATYSPSTAQCTHMLYLSTISRWWKMDLRTAEVLGGCKWVCQGRLLMQLVMQRIAALYLAIALEGFDAAASLCQTCQGGSVGQPCLGQESRSFFCQ